MEDLRAAHKAVGLKQSKKAVLAGRAQKAYAAADADPWVIEPFVELCKEHGVELVYAESMKALGRACHVEVPTACAVLLFSCEENR
ncbi:ribosomal L7Ae/L30e/S12e/Gadd45 family protein [Ructibacterium gallinarum]|uniref:Ribosomal L7Ae/L30e/S12e/Gadd45 family protein n=1 Tax=Ructibacterium gallinarum TaxID=2779355 RepID=A0A9D5R8E5_9FIRM|nr:ribosomal L7Ae/L30e/S12e/Gadd45 family protein [Ructibacterium gallinarum]MBE5039895.1 ribosomal L7Ae/L30e/S12e/Gadd45 family protein [Ructibacterium gallinarum]